MKTARRGGRTALVSGASSGIGSELAKLFAADGYDLVLVARRTDRLDQLADSLRAQHGAVIRVLSKDLADPSAPYAIFSALREEAVTVDALVNNAGFGSHGPFADADLMGEVNMIQVNATALTYLTGLFLPGMRERRSGKILNVASTAAFQPGPLMAVYHATKAYVLHFSEALAYELAGTGITVTALCPGPTRTEFQARSGVEHTRLLRRPIMDAHTVALMGYQGLLRGQAVVVPGLANRLLATAVRWLPRGMVARIVKRMQEDRRLSPQSPSR